jgi:hypothetical protein
VLAVGGLTACAGMPAAARPPAIGFLAREFGLRVGLTTLASWPWPQP